MYNTIEDLKGIVKNLDSELERLGTLLYFTENSQEDEENNIKSILKHHEVNEIQNEIELTEKYKEIIFSAIEQIKKA